MLLPDIAEAFEAFFHRAQRAKHWRSYDYTGLYLLLGCLGLQRDGPGGLEISARVSGAAPAGITRSLRSSHEVSEM